MEVLEETNEDWWMVRYGGLTGYAFTDYLAKVDAEEELLEEKEAKHIPTTTLLCDDGNCIVLQGYWRIAED